jgi:hypothetical protein
MSSVGASRDRGEPELAVLYGGEFSRDPTALSTPFLFISRDKILIVSKQQVQNPKSNVVGKTFPSAADMDALSKKCDKLSALRANVLRTTSFGTVAWERKDGKWAGGVKEGTAAAEQASGERIAAEAAANPRP